MNLWFRLICLLVASFFRPRLDVLAESVIPLRVWPSDLDINVHMNNARYLAVMDLGRFDLTVRSGLWRGLVRGGFRPVVASTLVRFRKPLRAFQPFRLYTRIVGWDDRRIYLEHRIEAQGVVACHALMRCAFLRTAGGSVPVGEVVRRLGYEREPPPLPAWVGSWGELDGALEAP